MGELKDILGLIISLSTVFGIFTGIINKVFTKKLKPIEDKIDKTEQDGLKRDMMMMRSQVINAASDLHRGIPLTKQQYDYIFDCMDAYEDYVKKLNITNNLFSSEEDFIKQCYKDFIENKWLVDNFAFLWYYSSQLYKGGDF